MIGTRVPLSPAKFVSVRRIYEQALDEPAEHRLAAAIRFCGGDSQLESEVNFLLAATDRVGSFLDKPAVLAMDCLAAKETTQVLSPDTVLCGRFKIVRFLNRGGMGEVYEAWDSELREVVALKTIRPDMASQPFVIGYFKEEVKHARRIAHPNVCRVYDLYSHGESSSDRLWFLAMQFLEGRTLSEHLRDCGPFPIKEAIRLVEDMIAGLDAAHELGVVHRDFKSSNIMLVPGTSGIKRAVITDFGLATRITIATGTAGQRRQGTLAYVAPEQWRDGVAGPSADQYALGIVICEMITGERPTPAHFDGQQPVPAVLPKDREIDERWEMVIRRCLELQPDDRFEKITEILPVLDPHRKQLSMLRMVTAFVILPILAAVAVFVIGRIQRLPRVQGLTQLTPAMSLSANPSFSHGGNMIAYVSDRAESGNLDIWAQEMPDGTPTRITNDPAADDEPAISPDGRKVVFTSDRDPAGIYISNSDGGGEHLLAPGGHDPRFSPDGKSILYWTGDENEVAASGSIYWLDLAALKPVRLASNFADAVKPIWNSDSQHVLFRGCPNGQEPLPTCRDWWVTSTAGEPPRNTSAMALLKSHQIDKAGEFGSWYGDILIFSAAHGQAMNLWELKISPKDAKTIGVPRQLTFGANQFISSSSLAGNNRLAFTQLTPAIHIWRIDNASTPKHSTAYKITQDAAFDLSPSISHNGRWLTFARGYGPDRRIIVEDTLSGKETLFPLIAADKFSPLIDDSRSTLAYEAWEGGVPMIYLARPGTPPVRLCTGCRNPTSWFDGINSLVYSNSVMSEIELDNLTTKHARTILSTPNGAVREATWSPENEFILFTVSGSESTGQVFGSRFPRGASAPDRHWIAITSKTDASEKPRWSGDGKTIFYLSTHDKFLCLWGQHFDPVSGRIVGRPFAVHHFHDQKMSPLTMNTHYLNLSVAGESVYLNIGEMSGTIWTGELAGNTLLSNIR